ncbi:MAG TPA: HRDC domain-containing protein [Gemmataceae bacterium]|nr:HRDC domain-containing protein [Gemmataceae bacterium]
MKPLPEYIVTDPGGVRACCDDVVASPHVGFDTEFVGEDTYVPDLCLIQVATPNALYVLDPYDCGPLDEFWNLIADPRRVVVVHAGREEVRICNKAIGRPPGNLFDVQIAAGLLGLGYPLGYGPLIQAVLRKRLSKGATLTDWRKRPLSQEQVRYAFDDVRDLLATWKRMDARLTKLGRTEWAQQEFDSFIRRSLMDGGEVERWRRLKGAANLDARRLAVVREVYRWREEAAAKRNRPARTVLRDDLVVEVAKRDPQQGDEISALRGVGRVDLPGLLAAVDRARKLPPEEWPEEAERDTDPYAIALVASLLNVVLADYCARHELTTPLVATSADVRRLVRAAANGEPPPADSALTSGWRKEHVLPILMEVLEGRRALRVRALEGESPLEYGHVRTG